MKRQSVAVLAGILLIGLCSAATPATDLTASGSPVIKFQPSSARAPESALVNDGSPYSAERGFGWDQDIRSQARDRGNGCTGVALIDSAVSSATFTIDLPDGDYLFEIAAGDSNYGSGLAVILDGEPALAPVSLRAGEFTTQAVPVICANGKARVSFVGGQGGFPNSVISSIKITPASADPAKWRKAYDAAYEFRQGIRIRAADRDAVRRRQRAPCAPLALQDARRSFGLSGDWLFMPTQDMPKGASGPDPKCDDSSWHVLGVPQFWNPIEWWIFNNAGTSHNYLRREIERCERFSFDYGNTNSGWYRRWIEVPESLRGRRFVLRFDAVASVAEVYWNGKRVGSHVGMFGAFECDVTPYVRFGGRNLLAVMVASGKADLQPAKESAGVAVTVNVTKEMLNSLPHGWFRPGLGGIWQPVTLEVTGKDRIADVYFRPSLDGAAIETAVDRSEGRNLCVRHTIADAASGTVLYRGPASVVPSGKGATTVYTSVSGLKPKLWSPEHPNLYRLKTQLVMNDTVVDASIITVGFRTLEARGSRLYLNGKPYFLRGADMPPHGLAMNDKALADKFMKLMRDGNTMATRFHVSPPSKVWLNACDKYGIIASVGEDWPWVLMGNNPIPDPKIMQAWKDEWAEIVRAARNHPSLLIWTISNESYFQGKGDPDQARRQEKYRIFSDVIKTVRRLDPDAVVVLHSGYIRSEPDFAEIIEPNALDDGDVDDIHCYFGWYSKSPFHLDVPKEIESRACPGRPLISQEASTGYPDSDTGHPTETYIRNHFVPQAWVGKYGTYSERPDMFLETHAQITKEYAEKIRRDRTMLSGWMIFANCCWFRDVYDADRIAPYPVYWAVKKAYEPVLVSLVNPNRHFEAGQTFSGDVCIVNDDPDRPKLNDLTLRWRIYGKSLDRGTSGSVRMPDCRYDAKVRTSVEFRVPENLPLDRANMTLEFELFSGDELISRNDYPLICAKRQWFTSDGGEVLVVESDTATSDYLRGLGFKCESAQKPNFSNLPVDTVVVAGPSAETKNMLDPLSDFVRRGGRILILGQPVDAIPDLPAGKQSVEASGDFADVLEPALLDGLDPMDMHWWNAESGGLPRVCATSYQIPDAPGLKKLVQHIQPHGYLKSPGDIARHTSWLVFELSSGKGRIIVSSLLLADDPISRRFTANLVRYLAR